MYIAIGTAAALFAADRILKYLSRTGKLKWEGRYVRLTHLENRGFFLGLGQKHEKLLRWLPLGVWLAAAACLLPELGKRAFAAQLGILSVLLGGISNQWDRLRRGSVTDYLQFPHRKAKKRALVWNLAALLCIVLGLFLGYLVLLLINPAGAGEAILTVIKNFMTYNRPASQLKYFGNTLVKTAPLLMCALAILFAYKVGLFNIGAAGQYCAGVALSLYAALGLGWSWLPCMLLAICGGAILGSISGLLKSYCNVNEVISGIMLNWIVLYLTNMLLTLVKEDASPYTKVLANTNASAVLPSLGLGALFNKNQYVGLAIPLAVVMAIVVWIVLDKTKFGYELKATGLNKNAAKYCGMAEKRNIILSLMISGALAGLGAAMLYLTSYEQWQCSSSSVPAMGFNGIAAAFLGGLNPIGSIFASFFIQHITAGGAYVDKSMYCAQISDLISALIIYLCGFVLFMKNVMSSVAARREEKAIAKAKALAEAKKGGETE